MNWINRLLSIFLLSLLLITSVNAEDDNSIVAVKSCSGYEDYCNMTGDSNLCGKGYICTELTEGLPKSAISDPDANADTWCAYWDNYMCKVVISKSGQQGIQGWIGFIYKISAVTIGLAAVLMIVWAGFQMSYSGGSKDVGNAKKMIYNAIYAIVLILLSGMILRFVNPDFFK